MRNKQNPKQLTDLEIAIKLEEIEKEETIKQTAVDYLFKELWDRPKDKLNWNYFLQKAKDMEREQILNAYGDGYFADRIKSVDELNIYYEENYGKNA